MCGGACCGGNCTDGVCCPPGKSWNGSCCDGGGTGGGTEPTDNNTNKTTKLDKFKNNTITDEHNKLEQLIQKMSKRASNDEKEPDFSRF
jgi:hypothetical protein